MKKFFMIFLLIAILSVSGCWNNAYPKPEAVNDAAESDSDGIESDDEDSDENFPGASDFDFMPEENPDKDPCDDLPCFGIIHADKCIAINNRDYVCVCETGWYLDGEDCVSPCDTDPCKNVTHSDGSCFAPSPDQYTCGCENNYFWDTEKCISPCDTDTCKDVPHSNGSCFALSPDQYICECENGYFLNNGECIEIPECTPTSPTPCRDLSTGLMWSSMYHDNWHQTKCRNIFEGNYNDWALPGLDKLTTLLQNCQAAETGGCEASDSGKYSKLGDTETLWSNWLNDNNLYFYVLNFSRGRVETFCDTICASMIEMTNMPPYDCGECFNGLYLRCARCEKGYFWYTADKACVKTPCKEDSCSDIPHSTGSCYPITPETYKCSCESNYAWDEKQKRCVNPCESNPCKMPHADGTCYTQTAESYRCGCEENYKWNSEEQKCVKKE